MTQTEISTHVYWRPEAAGDRNSLSVLAAFVPEGSRVLDLGIGGGELGRHLHDRLHCRLDGATINPDEQGLARPWYERIELLDLELPGWDRAFEDQSYDVIVCADVLEHLRRPEHVLAACHRLLRRNGVLLASIPNVAYAGMVAGLMQGDFEYGNEGLLDRTHLRFFTRRSFLRLLHSQGWQVQRIEAIEQPLHETEFTMAFDALPPAVGRHLLAQPDSSAYQLIFAATLSPDVPALPQRPLPYAPEVSAATFVAQLFVASGQGFSAERKLTRHGKIGAQRQTLIFDLPPDWTPWTGLRLDPADRPGFFWLHRITLRGPEMRVLWEWTASDESAAQLAASSSHQVETSIFDPDVHAVKLVLLGDDPYFELPIDPETAHRCGPGAERLEVECGWPMSADYLAAADRFQDLTQQNRDQATRINQFEAAQHAAVPSVPAGPIAATSPIVAAPTPRPPPTPTPSAIRRGWDRFCRLLHGVPNDLRPARGVAGAFDDTVEIVVPIYNNLPLVQRCVKSVLAMTGRTRFHLALINDASPDLAVRAWLQAFAADHPGITVIENARNLGFVDTVNLGMRLAGRRDVVLLNSDTEVANDWLDRLRAAAFSRDAVGTVTPFSNNATICSYPQFCVDNPLLPDQDTASIDQLCASTNPGRTVEIPTAVGFCMYIRRACLDQVGEFDAANFGKGYGEENDFCLRATALGWLHLHALDVFVYHEGGGSFKETRVALQANALQAIRRLHPGYEDLIRAFVQRDPARPFREALDRARAENAPAASATPQAQQAA